MLNRDLSELRSMYGVARASADLLRRSGEAAKAARVESLARLIAREIRRRDAGGAPAPVAERARAGGPAA